jgi:hypothetical protein
MDDIIKLLYIYGFDTSNKISVYTLKQHVVHNIHRLAWGHYGRGAPCSVSVRIFYTTQKGKHKQLFATHRRPIDEIQCRLNAWAHWAV